jgi:hypothetical protein
LVTLSCATWSSTHVVDTMIMHHAMHQPFFFLFLFLFCFFYLISPGGECRKEVKCCRGSGGCVVIHVTVMTEALRYHTVHVSCWLVNRCRSLGGLYPKRIFKTLMRKANDNVQSLCCLPCVCGYDSNEYKNMRNLSAKNWVYFIGVIKSSSTILTYNVGLLIFFFYKVRKFDTNLTCNWLVRVEKLNSFN